MNTEALATPEPEEAETTIHHDALPPPTGTVMEAPEGGVAENAELYLALRKKVPAARTGFEKITEKTKPSNLYKAVSRGKTERASPPTSSIGRITQKAVLAVRKAVPPPPPPLIAAPDREPGYELAIYCTRIDHLLGQKPPAPLKKEFGTRWTDFPIPRSKIPILRRMFFLSGITIIGDISRHEKTLRRVLPTFDPSDIENMQKFLLFLEKKLQIKLMDQLPDEVQTFINSVTINQTECFEQIPHDILFQPLDDLIPKDNSLASEAKPFYIHQLHQTGCYFLGDFITLSEQELLDCGFNSDESFRYITQRLFDLVGKNGLHMGTNLPHQTIELLHKKGRILAKAIAEAEAEAENASDES